MTHTWKKALVLGAPALALLALIAGCGPQATEREVSKTTIKPQAGKSSSPGADESREGPRAPSLEALAGKTSAEGGVAVVTTDLTLGKNRFSLALLDKDERPIRVTNPVVYFSDEGREGPSRGPFPATLRTENLEGKEIYVTALNFGEAGTKEGLLLGSDKAGAQVKGVFRFNVYPEGSTPGVGSAAIPSENPTEKEKKLAQLCTRTPPCSMHKASIRETLDRRRPAVIVFATPRFCASKMCAPVLDNALALVPKYGAKVQFIHVEIYRDNRPPEPAPTVVEWNLASEPWVFLVDKQGKINAKFEGPVTTAELDQAIAGMLQGS